eukprot:1157413-Pelagomonas_calceolata.AAC.2
MRLQGCEDAQHYGCRAPRLYIIETARNSSRSALRGTQGMKRRRGDCAHVRSHALTGSAKSCHLCVLSLGVPQRQGLQEQPALAGMKAHAVCLVLRAGKFTEAGGLLCRD